MRVAEDKDFEVLKIYLSRNDGWNLNYERGKTAVWTRQAPESEFSMIRVSNFFFFFQKFVLLCCAKTCRDNTVGIAYKNLDILSLAMTSFFKSHLTHY